MATKNPPRGARWIGGTVAGVILIGVVAAWALSRPDPRQEAARAEAQGRWEAALDAWRAVNRTSRADARSLLGEARSALALGRAGQAERALERAVKADPSDPEPWLLHLELLRLEDRPLDARRVGEAALAAVPADSRREVLKALTLALLAEAPDDLARDTLKRWIAADPDDLDARVALLRRVAADPRPDDPATAARAAELADLLARHPEHIAAREALVLALDESGNRRSARAALDAWPESGRDARYDRLRGRWDLDYDRAPLRAAASFRRVVAALPHDWRAHYGLARSLESSDDEPGARRAADSVALLRESLDPLPLRRRLDTALSRLDDPRSRLDLADLCARVGLSDLASAWRLDAEIKTPAPEPHVGLTPLVPKGPAGRSDH